MMKAKNSWLLLLGVALTATILGCSSSSNPYSSGGGGGGGGREFVSGDMAPGNSFTHVFQTAKVIPYYCRYHGGPGGVGMSGVITVTAGGTPTTHLFSIANSTLPTMTIHVKDTVTWTNNTAMVHTVESDH